MGMLKREAMSLVEYLQNVAGMDTNFEGDVVKIEIMLHPDFDLVVITDEETAYFNTDAASPYQGDVLYQVEGPDEVG